MPDDPGPRDYFVSCPRCDGGGVLPTERELGGNCPASVIDCPDCLGWRVVRSRVGERLLLAEAENARLRRTVRSLLEV